MTFVWCISKYICCNDSLLSPKCSLDAMMIPRMKVFTRVISKDADVCFKMSMLRSN